MRSGRRRRPGVQRADVHAVGADKPDAVDDNPPRTAAAAIGAGGTPVVVFPSVNMTITLWLVEAASNSSIALVNASPWLVLPPAVNELTAFFSVATEVISCVSAVAVLEKLTIPIWLPEPI